MFSVNLSPGITLFTGSNGIGKTTILEAVSLLGNGRSFRPAKNEDFIQKSKESAALSAKIRQDGLDSELSVKIYTAGKKFFLDGKLVRKLSSIHHLVPSVVFSPNDHQIIDGDSAERKNFLNRAASIYDWSYAEVLSDFNKVLLQRNKLLKQLQEEGAHPAAAAELLYSWDEQLVHFGTELCYKRNHYLRNLLGRVKNEYQRIAQREDSFDLAYQAFGDEHFPTNCSQNEIKNYFAQHLRGALRRDLAIGSTSVGPHKDDILLTLNGNRAKFYGSQGERRTCALALRLGEVALFKEKHKRSPVLLIDDVSSELDNERRNSLVELLHQESEQVLITATELPSALMRELDKNFTHFDLQEMREGKHGYHGKNVELHSG